MPKLPPHEWLKEYRLDKKIRQEDVERFTASLGARSKISQSHLSKIERGNAPLIGLGAERINALRMALGLSAEDWVENTGIQVVTTAPQEEERPLTDAERRGWKIPKVEKPLEVPDSLQEAIDLYAHGDNAPMAEPRWVRAFLSIDFREEPELPEDWLRLYARLKTLINPR